MKIVVLRRVVLVLGVCCAAASLFAWRWPLSDAEAQSDFGSVDRKIVRAGVDIQSTVGEVRAIQDGTVIFAATNHPGSRRMPVPMKAMIAISHDDEIVSVYEGLLPESVNQWSSVSGDQARVREGGVIAKLAPEQAMRLLISDTKLSAWINPFLTLPVLPDDRPPVISDVGILYPPQTEPEALRDRMDARAKEFTLKASVRDVIGLRGQGAGLSTAPYSMTVVWNGAVVYSHENIMLRRSKSDERSLEYSTVTPAAERASRRFLSGDIVLSLTCADGLNRLEIRASDLAGNRVSAVYRMTFEPPAAPSNQLEKPKS